MRLGLFSPSREEVDALARDLIVRHGLDAYDEAIRLSEVVQLLPHSIRQQRLYQRAAARIEESFKIARQAARNRVESDPTELDEPPPSGAPSGAPSEKRRAPTRSLS